MVSIGLLGGTGIEAKGLALRFAACGAAVVVGSRSGERASQAAEACNRILGKPLVRGLENGGMIATCEIVFLTVPFALAAEAVESCRRLFNSDNILVDVTVPMVFRAGHAVYHERDELSNSEIIARHLPDGVPLVAAFKTIPAAVLADLGIPLDCDVFVCSDSREAKQKVMATAALVSTLRPLDGGPLRAARTLERMSVLAAELNRRYKSKGARFRVEGI